MHVDFVPTMGTYLTKSTSSGIFVHTKSQITPNLLIRTLLEWEQPYFHRTVITSFSLTNESDDGLPHSCHCKFISWNTMHLKCLINSKHPILLIKPIRCMGFHHPPQPANTGTAARRVDNALCFYIANK
jgi:hypothetical protein